MVPLLEGGGDWWFVMVRRSVVVLVLVALVFVGACGDGGGLAPAVLSVSIDQEGVVLEVGESVALSVTVEAVGGASRDVEWASDDESIATVSDEGVVTAVAVGEATVVTTSAFDDSRSGSVVVTVVASDDGDPVGVSVSVEPVEVTLAPGEEQVFTATVVGAVDDAVSWDASCGSIEGTGGAVTFTAPADEGSCTVTVASVEDPAAEASAVVTVVGAGLGSVPALVDEDLAEVLVGGAGVVVSTGGETELSGSSGEVPVELSEGLQLLLLRDASGNDVALGRFLVAPVAGVSGLAGESCETSASVEFGVEQTALALASLFPEVALRECSVYPAWAAVTREESVAFGALVEHLRGLYRDDPANVLDGDVYPLTYELARAAALEGLELAGLGLEPLLEAPLVERAVLDPPVRQWLHYDFDQSLNESMRFHNAARAHLEGVLLRVAPDGSVSEKLPFSLSPVNVFVPLQLFGAATADVVVDEANSYRVSLLSGLMWDDSELTAVERERNELALFRNARLVTSDVVRTVTPGCAGSAVIDAMFFGFEGADALATLRDLIVVGRENTYEVFAARVSDVVGDQVESVLSKTAELGLSQATTLACELFVSAVKYISFTTRVYSGTNAVASLSSLHSLTTTGASWSFVVMPETVGRSVENVRVERIASGVRVVAEVFDGIAIEGVYAGSNYGAETVLVFDDPRVVSRPALGDRGWAPTRYVVVDVVLDAPEDGSPGDGVEPEVIIRVDPLGTEIRVPVPLDDVVSVSVEPASAELGPGESRQFAASVTGASDASVTWAATCGSIGGSGSPVTYTAPGSEETCLVRATSVADEDAWGEATVTVVEPPTDAPATSAAAGYEFSLALRDDGTVLAWGSGLRGQLGDGGTTDWLTPVAVVGLDRVEGIAAGWDHALAVRDDGTVWAWGWNSSGQLGDGSTADRSMPVQVLDLSNVREVAGGSAHSLALRQDGTVWAWGSNSRGLLGDGTTTSRSEPVQVVGLTNVRSIAAGSLHSLAVGDDGTVWAWGWNTSGQLGDGSFSDRSTPVQVVGLPEVRSVSAGIEHSLAVGDDGTVWAWGWNSSGQLGDGTFSDRSTPVQVVGLSDARSGAAGGYYSLAVLDDGTVWAWGGNSQGELGDGRDVPSLTPVQVLAPIGAESVTAWWSHSLMVGEDGSVWGWGSNRVGELGDGTTTDRGTPVQVVGLSGASP